MSAPTTAPSLVRGDEVASLSPSELDERTIHRRAVEAVIWGMAAVNVDLMWVLPDLAKVS